MNASNAFRSHLMQQFYSVARTQTRPPLALIGWLSEDENRNVYDNVPSSTTNRFIMGAANTNSSSDSIRKYISSIDTTASQMRPRSPTRKPSCNFLDTCNFSTLKNFTDDSSDNSTSEEVQLADAFQNLLQTRRTNIEFAPPLSHRNLDKNYWSNALQRAVYCGYTAPNHKRTEPFTFKRMIAPSQSTRALANIAYNVSYKQKMAKAGVSGATEASVIASAQKKRDKWNNIPAYLVVLCQAQHKLVEAQELEDRDEYDILEFKPPKSERELEDYASACAAVQNVLLSLHSENIASKWATGATIQTPAFRKLVQASEYDRVVALVMIGVADDKKQIRPRKHRREFLGDVLVDL